MRFWRRSAPSAAAFVAVLFLGACGSHGAYTSAARDDARSSIDAIHAGTEYDEAMRRFRNGDFDGALESIDESLRLSEAVPKSHLLRARIFVEMGGLGAALDAIDAGLAVVDGIARSSADDADPARFDAQRAQFFYERGLVHEQQGLPDEAVVAYRRALELAPDDAPTRHALAEVHVQRGDLDAAKKLLTSSSGWSSGEAGFRQSLGHIALLEGDADAARRLFEEAAILSPRDPSILEDLFRSRVEARQFAEALATAELLEQQLYYDRRPDLKRLHALCHIQVREPVEARAILKRLTEGDGGARDFESWRLMADVAVLLDDDRLLRAAADRMIQAAPLRSEGFLAQAVGRRREGDLEGALASARLAVERSAEGDSTPAKFEAIVLDELASGDSDEAADGSTTTESGR